MYQHEAATTVRELPEALPDGERILWQDAPDWRALYRRAFHGRTLAVYFALVIASRGLYVSSQGAVLADALMAMLWLLPFALFALGALAFVAWLTARASWYTITDRRVVMRIGVVLEITFNFPFRLIEEARLAVHGRDGSGDIALVFVPGEQVAYAHLWPHVRPWRFARSEPMLRCIPRAAEVARLLAAAIASASGGQVLPVCAPAANDTGVAIRPPMAAAS